MLRAVLWWQSKSQERLLDFIRSISLLLSHKDQFYLPLLVGLLAAPIIYITKVGHWRKDVLEGHDIKVKIFADINETTWKVFLFKTVGRVFDRDIIFRDRIYLEFSFLGYVVKLQSNLGNRVCVLFLLLFFFFLLLAFFLLHLYRY